MLICSKLLLVRSVVVVEYSFRTKFILGFSIFMGILVPQYFNEYTTVARYGPVHTGARWFNDIINVIFSSKPFVVGLMAFFLDNTLHRCDGSIRRRIGVTIGGPNFGPSRQTPEVISVMYADLRLPMDYIAMTMLNY